MMELPSKELLSAVLDCEIEDSVIEDNTIWPLEFSSWRKGEMQLCNCKKYPRGINIYELMNVMKEYIKSQNLMIIVYHHLDTVAVEIVQNQKSIYTSPGMSVYTEPEAVTKACEWILEQQK